jgi:hypothetical protein
LAPCRARSAIESGNAIVILRLTIVSTDRAGFSYLASDFNASVTFAAGRALGGETGARDSNMSYG